MTADELANLKPGDKVRWVGPRSNISISCTVTLSHRKDDGSGWWNTDGSGLDDKLALLTDTWQVVR